MDTLKHNFIKYFVFITLAFLAGFNRNTKLEEKKDPSAFENAFRIISEISLCENKNNFIGSVSDFSVDSQGNLWLLDGRNCNIKKYDEKGRFLKSISNKGRGPGELLLPASIFVSKDELYVLDLMLRKLMIFHKNGRYKQSLDMKYSRLIKLSMNKELVVGGVRISGKKKGYCIHLYNKKGKLKRSFFPISNAAYRIGLRCRGVYFDLDNRDNIYCAQEADNLIHIFKLNGKLLKSFPIKNQYYVFPPSKPLKKIYLKSVADAWIQSWTHVNKIEVLNNGRLLVNLLTFKPSMYSIDVYDLDGNFIIGGIASNYRLLCTDKNDYQYFLKEEIDNGISYKILKCELIY